MSVFEYPPCKKCGASHGMGIENMETGEIEPIDICYNCLWDVPQNQKKVDKCFKDVGKKK